MEEQLLLDDLCKPVLETEAQWDSDGNNLSCSVLYMDTVLFHLDSADFLGPLFIQL